VQASVSLVSGVVFCARVVLGGVVLAAASFVFVRSLSPQDVGTVGAGVRTAPRQTVPVVRPRPQTRIYYYVVGSEQKAKEMLDDRVAAADYYGTGYPSSPPIIVVARTEEIFESLRDVLAQTAAAGGPPYTVIDLR
jgi:hypothetical protein